MSPAFGPIVSTSPNTTSSTAAGSMPVRSTRALIECAPRSAGCTCDSPPPRRPTGERTASTMYASVILFGPSDLQLLRDAVTVPGGVAERSGEHPCLLQVAVQLVLDGVADGAMALQGPA